MQVSVFHTFAISNIIKTETPATLNVREEPTTALEQYPDVMLPEQIQHIPGSIN